MATPQRPWLTRTGVLGATWTCLLSAAGLVLHIAQNRGDPHLGGLLNDFFDYWAAARILDLGGNPYDAHVVGQVLTAAGIHSTVGTGYSYPLLMAELARPLGALPPWWAGALFTAGSLAALWLAMALLLSPIRRTRLLEVLALGAAAALFGPVSGTLYMGQVNLYLLPLLALALRQVLVPVGLAVASAVKLYPVAAVLTFAVRGLRGLPPLLLTLALAVALAVGPNLLTGTWSYGAQVVRMFGPDPYWSNQSINGWLSRLALPVGGAPPPLPGLPVTATMLALCALLGGLTVVLLALRRDRPWPAAYVVLVAYSTVAAPKNSLWNLTPLLVVGLQCWSAGWGRPQQRALVVTAWALAGPASVLAGLLSGAIPEAWLSSLPLYSGLLLFGVAARQLLIAPPEIADQADPEVPEAWSVRTAAVPAAAGVGRPWLSVVIPAFNEARRLPASLARVLAYLRELGEPFEVIVADDGSRDGTGEVARSAGAEVRVVRIAHAGKGAAVRAGVLDSSGDLVLISDADLATPIEDLERLRSAVEAGADLALGSRRLPGSQMLRPQPAHRRLMGRAFGMLVRTLVLPDVRDSQCGFKLFRGPLARQVFSQTAADGFAFEVEAILLVRGLGGRVAEIPVRWQDAPESRVRPLPDAAAMLRELLAIRLRAAAVIRQPAPVPARSRPGR